MNKIFLTGLALISLLTACKKKEDSDPEPESTTTTGTPAVTEYSYSQSIGTSGAGFNEFNFNMNGQEQAWTMASDGDFIYVGDYGNSCIKKVNLSNSTIVGWYGFKNGAWGYYTAYTTAPDPLFKPFRVVCKNGFLYAFSPKSGTSQSLIYKFDVDANSAIDTSRVIPEQSFYSVAIDTYENIYVVKGDSIRKYAYNNTVTRFGGFGSADGKLDNGGWVVQALCKGDTLVVMDGGNVRIQKFSNTGSFISKFAATTGKNHVDLCLYGDKYYFISPNGKLTEYSPGGTLLNSYTIKNNPSGFTPSQKQLVVIGNKVVFQDMYTHKLHVYTK